MQVHIMYIYCMYVLEGSIYSDVKPTAATLAQHGMLLLVMLQIDSHYIIVHAWTCLFITCY